MNPLVHYAVAFLGPQYVADRLTTDRGNGVLESVFSNISMDLRMCLLNNIEALTARSYGFQPG